jgi:hypothetical protein
VVASVARTMWMFDEKMNKATIATRAVNLCLDLILISFPLLILPHSRRWVFLLTLR